MENTTPDDLVVTEAEKEYAVMAGRYEPPSDTLVLVGTGAYNEQFYVRETFDEITELLEGFGPEAAIILHLVGRDGDRVLIPVPKITAVIDLTKEADL